MDLHVLHAVETVKTSDLLIFLGIGLLKLAQTLVYLAQYNVYVNTVFCHLRCKDKHLSPNDKTMIHIP